MKNYTYYFNNEITTIEVSEQDYELLCELDKQEKNNNKRETRRHISLNYLNSKGIDFEARGCEPLTQIIKKEQKEKLYKAIAKLKPSQQKIAIAKIFEGKTVTEIAKIEGVTHQVISKRLKVVYKKLENFF